MGEAPNGDVRFGGRVLIVGTVSNVSEKLRADFACVRNAFSDDFEVFTYLVESDSSDETIAALNDLSISNKNFNFISFGCNLVCRVLRWAVILDVMLVVKDVQLVKMVNVLFYIYQKQIKYQKHQ